MPYIITTVDPVDRNQSKTVAGGVLRYSADMSPVFPGPTGVRPSKTTRIAVATLGEARASVDRAVTDTPGYTASVGFPTDAAIADAISESGGSVGPLPDGTTIEVRPVAWRDLIQTMLDAGEDNYPPLIWDTAEDRADILTAFNAQR